MQNFDNIAQVFERTATQLGGRPAMWFSHGRTFEHLTFESLFRYSAYVANALLARGVKPGDKTLVMLRPGPELTATVFALFRIGAVPVLIDPGMGISRLLTCVTDVEPDILIAVPMVHWVRLIRSKPLAAVRCAFSFSRVTPPGVTRLFTALQLLTRIRAGQVVSEQPKMYVPDPEFTAAILFTTGSTGPAKGVKYTHRVFLAQTEFIAQTYGAGPDYFDMPVFPLFALFSAALGMPCVIPVMDPSRPAKADPVRIIKLIRQFNISFSFGSPAFWQTVASYCIHRNIKLYSLKKVLMAGAPPSPSLLRMMRLVLPDDAKVCIPYGATEAMPIATFTGSEILSETAAETASGGGYCVGLPIGDAEIKVIAPVEGVIQHWHEVQLLSEGEVGEIAVHGSVVAPGYYHRPDADAKSKIMAADGSLWHRMGDMGRIDHLGRIWFCGRKAHRVITDEQPLYSVCCEAVFNSHPDVRRSALVGVGKNGREPVIIIEPQRGAFPKSAHARKVFADEMLNLGAKSTLTQQIRYVLFYRDFPVDIRHNAKIFREKLAEWAEDQLL